MAYKILLWLLAHYFFTSYVVFTKNSSKSELCYCAVMNKTEDVPLLIHEFPNKLGCGAEAKEGCSTLCRDIAEATKQSGEGPRILCQEIPFNGSLIVNIYSKVCKGKYTYTGLEYEKPVCCKKGKVCDKVD